MKRREFIALVGGALTVWPTAVCAQQSGTPLIGFLDSASADEFAPFLAAFLLGLNEAGFVEGRNVTIEYRWAEGRYDRLPVLAAEMVRVPVTVLARAAKAATTTIPIVFNTGGDPVRFGLVASLNKPL